ncbi:MAG: hypothetical protein H6657_00310 [Ardenticatenaceae bacterium]|nr:hypothetical protein [Anaerolineales bacterium]MCB8975855.1 hypothetical protein [Ardenticatenaceae bacterium]
MNTNGTQSNRHLIKMKVALAVGGLVTTLIGAGLLGSQAEATTVTTAATTTTTIEESSSITEITLPELDLSLEAIPTVAAPTFSANQFVARGRSSG